MQQGTIEKVLIAVCVTGIIASNYATFKTDADLEPEPGNGKPLAGSVFDISVDVDDNAKSLLSSLMLTRKATVAGWSIEIQRDAALKFVADGIEIVGGVTATGKAGILPVSVGLTRITVENGDLLLRFRTGIIRVRLY